MKTPLELLSEVQIPIACPVQWEDMIGDDYLRHCAGCNREVYNLSVLSAAEAVRLIRAKEGQLCAQLYRRADGTVLTTDCSARMQGQSQRAVETLLAAAAVFGSVLAISAPRPGEPYAGEPTTSGRPIPPPSAGARVLVNEPGKNEPANQGQPLVPPRLGGKVAVPQGWGGGQEREPNQHH
jgi:hypothetical protein